MSANPPQFNSSIWLEEAAPYDPFVAERCYCSGYDVHGDILRHADYLEYLYLLFRGEKPSGAARRSLEIIAIALANPGPRDPSVHAAMCAGVGGSPAAAALIAALAVGAGATGGARELFRCMEAWQAYPDSLAPWLDALSLTENSPHPTRREIWPETDHCPGFLADTGQCPLPVRQTLAELIKNLPDQRLGWLHRQRSLAEDRIGLPLGMLGVIAAALLDLGFSPAQGEMLTLLLRLPGAAVHALEQQATGIRRFPFFSINLSADPATRKSNGENQ